MLKRQEILVSLGSINVIICRRVHIKNFRERHKKSFPNSFSFKDFFLEGLFGDEVMSFLPVKN